MRSFRFYSLHRSRLLGLALGVCAFLRLQDRGSVAAQEAAWTRCADEFSYCHFSGRRDVRLTSADGRSVVREYFQTARCAGDADGFGVDPAPATFKYCEFGPQKFETLPAPEMNGPMPGMTMGPQVDLTRIPLGDKGYDTFRVRPISTPPRPDDIGAFRTVCSLSHMKFDDPIVFPGRPGASHLHAFFGNTGAGAASTSESIANSGNGTCRGGTANRTAYWVPALIDTRDGSPVLPFEAHFYYKSGYNGIAPSAVQPMPKGLRMIAGSMQASSAQEVLTWGCIDGDSMGASIQNCAPGQQLQMSVRFPQCWNGRDLDSADHKSHMSYVVNRSCPATHPVPIPEITFNIRYPVVEAGAPLRWRLASDMYDPSLPGGFSGHGDWWNGWDEGVERAFIQGCDNKSVDCYSDLLGDGREIF
ncbi:MAG: hypothetical protein JWN48_249 [Myxococcaceae bacterium]|nr:hypothetical protein [Myxococcaceae bacterium]